MAGRSEEARSVTGALGKEAQGLPFTQDGMADLLHETRIQYLLGRIAAIAGDAAGARAHWQAAGAQRGPFAILAAKELGAADWRARAEHETSRADDAEFSGARAPGAALLLHALGRDREAADLLVHALLAPDRRLSHYIARTALSELDPGVVEAALKER